MHGLKHSTVAAAGGVCVALITGLAGTASAATFDLGIPVGWTCTGACGTSAANGIVTLAPGGGSRYGYVTTDGGTPGTSLSIGGDSGSMLRSGLFAAVAGDALEFYFDYVTSDGAGYADYAWARLLDGAGSEVALLFTARTTPSGDAVPGFGVPAPVAVLTPSPAAIIPGGPAWSPLGVSSGTCFSTGCGYTDWVKSEYTITATGSYRLEFGSTNWSDTLYDSGLAFDGLTLAGAPLEEEPAIPEPATLTLVGLGLAAAARRRLRR